VSGERWPGLLVLLISRVMRKMTWATDVVNIIILCVRKKMAWATGVVNITCQEKDGLGYWCC
jgi:hypothetical protein